MLVLLRRLRRVQDVDEILSFLTGSHALSFETIDFGYNAESHG